MSLLTFKKSVLGSGFRASMLEARFNGGSGFNALCFSYSTSYMLCWTCYSRRQKKFPYSTVLLPYFIVLLPYFNLTYALLPAYFHRTLIVLLPHPLTYCNRTTAVLSPYSNTTIIDWYVCSRIFMGTENNAGE